MNKNHWVEFLIRTALVAVTLWIWWWVIKTPMNAGLNLGFIVGGVLLVFPIIWLGRNLLDRKPTAAHSAWTSTFVHYSLLILFGAAIIRAILTHEDWIGWRLPIPPVIGLLLVRVTGIVALLSVVNLALKGFGAPFVIHLSERLAVDWLYAWTRNPMVLATLACLLSVGIWYQSSLFVVWVLALLTPAWLFFVVVYEERELEIRFGASYLEYKSRTPLLFPHRPRKNRAEAGPGGE